MRTAILTAAALLALPAAASAQPFELDYVGARAGSMGLGGEVGFELLPGLSGRIVANSYDFSYDTEASGVNYEGDLSLGTFGAQLDFQPIPLVPLYLTGGIYRNGNEVSVTGRPTTATQIGNTVYSPAQIGTLTSTVTFDDWAPYAGLGLRFGFGPAEMALEGGVLRQGEPQAALSATGLLASDPAFRADLARESAALVDELDEFELYPVVNLSLRFKF